MFDIESFTRNKGVPHKYGFGRKGREIKLDCPVCGGDYKLWCSLFNEVYFCHKCRWSTTNPEKLVRYVMGCDPFTAALLCNKFQKPREYNNLEDYVKDSLGDSFLDDDVIAFYSGQQELPPLELPEHFHLLGDPRIPTINHYALSRGFSFRLLLEHKFGGCPLGRYKGSLILPAYHGDELMFWQARDALGRDSDDFPKYRTPIGYSSNGVLFNLDEASSFGEVIICEGVFSALRVGRDAVATFGNKITEEQCLLLRKRGVKRVVLCFDPDTWQVPDILIDRGLSGTRPPIHNAMLNLLDHFDSVRVVKLKEGDPDDIGLERGAKDLRLIISRAETIFDYSDMIKIMVLENT